MPQLLTPLLVNTVPKKENETSLLLPQLSSLKNHKNMSSLQFQSIISSNPNPNFDENVWMIYVRKSIEEDFENDVEIPVSIFNVPKILMASDPDTYTPQQVAIGPYHHWRPELYEMERYKLAAAKRTQKHLHNNLKFQYLVDHLNKLEPRIRACYHKFLDFSNEMLAWMMAIDASFLLEFLHNYAIGEGVEIPGISSSMSHLPERKSADHSAVLRDMVMLENQIPLFVLRKFLEIQFSSLEFADQLLLAMLIGFYKELSPFKMSKEATEIPIPHCSHLLDYLYHMIVSKEEALPAASEITEAASDDSEAVQGKERLSKFPSCIMKDLFRETWQKISETLFSRPVKLILKLPWTILSNLPAFLILKQLVEQIFPEAKQKEEIKRENVNNEVNKGPLVEEIAIPSVTDLVKGGVRFIPVAGNISSTNFDAETVTFYLPIISLDVNTEVVLRNLVAYEASNTPGPLIFTRYTELMNGIIDTDEDVKLLREKGIILNRLKSDEEAAKLWNGMSKSIRLTKVPFLDKVIEDVNEYYNGRWKIKAEKFVKYYVYGSWQFLTLVVVIFVLVLMTLQVSCSVYNIFHITSS